MGRWPQRTERSRFCSHLFPSPKREDLGTKKSHRLKETGSSISSAFLNKDNTSKFQLFSKLALVHSDAPNVSPFRDFCESSLWLYRSFNEQLQLFGPLHQSILSARNEFQLWWNWDGTHHSQPRATPTKPNKRNLCSQYDDKIIMEISLQNNNISCLVSINLIRNVQTLGRPKSIHPEEYFFRVATKAFMNNKHENTQ